MKASNLVELRQWNRGAGRCVNSPGRGTMEVTMMHGEYSTLPPAGGAWSRLPVDVRLWSRIRCSPGCWEWQGPKQNKGYGTLRYQGRDQLAHRVAYLLAIGPIPDGVHVLHRCDNPGCCRPDHLFLGTHADNMADMAIKGRAGMRNRPELARRGEANNKAKLTESQVREIRARYRPGDGKRLGREYGVTNALICMIVKRQVWRHVA